MLTVLECMHQFQCLYYVDMSHVSRQLCPFKQNLRKYVSEVFSARDTRLAANLDTAILVANLVSRAEHTSNTFLNFLLLVGESVLTAL